MADQPVPFNTFRGLNLRDAPDSVGDQCIDCLNIDLDRSGTSVRSRYGYAALDAVSDIIAFAYVYGGHSTAALLFGGPSGLWSVNSSGTSTAIVGATQLGGIPATIGTPSTTSTYYTASVATSLEKLVGTTRSVPTATVDGVGARAMPKGGYLAVQPNDNRLVVAPTNSTGGPNGASNSTSHVWFSDAGNPESWSSTNYVQLTPGDGEAIQFMLSWRGNLFVFKETRLFVFYGNSTDANGNPVFNYRTVSLPSRLLAFAGKSAGPIPGPPVTAGEDGVYFVAADGVYVTTGDVPTLLSGDLYPLGTDDVLPAAFSGTPGRWKNALTIHFHKRRLFVSLYGTDSRTFVYDIDSGDWTVWSIAPGCFATWSGEDTSGLLYFVPGVASQNHVYRFKSSYTTDAGTAISSYYRTGFYDLGDGDQKTIHNVDIWGTGTINYSSARDFNATMGTARSVTLGTSPAIGYGRTQPSADTARGNLFSHKFADSSGGAWSVQRVVQNVQAKRPPGPKGT